jgi:hypothetical protein
LIDVDLALDVDATASRKKFHEPPILIPAENPEDF